MKAAATIPLVRVVDLEEAGGVPHFVDLRATGEKDLVLLQGAGLYWTWTDIPSIIELGMAEEKLGHDHFCLTAVAPDGGTLWQVDAPWREHRPYWSHGAERTLTFADVDGDGVDELLALRRNDILVVKPGTGAVVHEHRLPDENIEILVAGRTGTGPRDWTIFAGVSCQGKAGAYGNPGFFYDTDFNLLETRDYLGAGHAPQAVDLDGDGLDEWLIGYELINSDLTVRWRFEAEAFFSRDDPEMHVDAMDHGSFAKDGPLTIAYAASNLQFVVDGAGELLWSVRRTHPQQCWFGRFLPDAASERQLFVVNKRAEIELVDGDGGLLWSVTPEQNWPLGVPRPFAEGHRFHLFDPSHVLRGAGEGGSDLVLYLEAGWPYLVNGRGERCAELEHTPEIAQDYPWTAGRPDDQGYGFLAVTDEREDAIRLVLADRRHAWEYEVPKQM